MFKVIGWENGGFDEVEMDTFDVVADAVAFVKNRPGFDFLNGFGEEGYDIIDNNGNLVLRFMWKHKPKEKNKKFQKSAWQNNQPVL